jgi:DNA-binding CsgD family transcriptional regulator
MVHRQGSDVDLTPMAGLMSRVPEHRGAALLNLLHSSAGVSGSLSALDGHGHHVVVASLEPLRSPSATVTRELTAADGGQVGLLRFTSEPMTPHGQAAVATLTPCFAAVAEVVSRRSRLGLTPRERDIVSAIADGLTNAEIARRDCVSIRTVTTHVEAIFRKLGVTNRVQAARIAIDCAMVSAQSAGLVSAHGLAAS